MNLEIRQHAEHLHLRLSGDLTIHTIAALHAELSALRPETPVRVDLGAVERLDTAGAWALVQLVTATETAGHDIAFDGLDAHRRALLDTVRAALPHPAPPSPRSHGPLAMLERLGKTIAGALGMGLAVTGTLGLVLARLGHVLRHPRAFHLTALVHHCQDVGLRAVSIVSIMALAIGVVLAFQGSVQLQQFGAEVFVVELIAISILRELGVLLTAIIVAGRTASSYAAAIGSMKMREEIDAMQVFGIDPALALFLPRVLALVLMLPILTLIANVVGMFGGAMMAWVELGISPSMFYIRLVDEVSVRHAMVGLVKAPVFAVIIGVIGCHAGMQVGGNAESLGRMTSAAVVAAVFLVILTDALFSVFFARLEI